MEKSSSSFVYYLLGYQEQKEKTKKLLHSVLFEVNPLAGLKKRKKEERKKYHRSKEQNDTQKSIAKPAVGWMHKSNAKQLWYGDKICFL